MAKSKAPNAVIPTIATPTVAAPSPVLFVLAASYQEKLTKQRAGKAISIRHRMCLALSALPTSGFSLSEATSALVPVAVGTSATASHYAGWLVKTGGLVLATA